MNVWFKRVKSESEPKQIDFENLLNLMEIYYQLTKCDGIPQNQDIIYELIGDFSKIVWQHREDKYWNDTAFMLDICQQKVEVSQLPMENGSRNHALEIIVKFIEKTVVVKLNNINY